jgi:hypothetical protein
MIKPRLGYAAERFEARCDARLGARLEVAL